MSYQVLARKWRPASFEQLVGQQHVVTVLVNALAQQRLHHAYLFTGTRGVGKTTIARIFAKSLNCLTGVTATPCGVCNACLDIDQGRFIDLLEIDAASRTKVDDTREILDNVQYAPTSGRYKVYLIDEVHMLSRSSFNALLKTLEEPPEHVKFILATTEPNKIPATVLSRCLQFHLKALSVSQIEQKLTQILIEEKVTSAPGTLTMLAKAARGSMRDSLSLTDQAIAQGQGDITLANLREMLGGVDQNWVYKILVALVKQDASELMRLSQEIASYAPSYNRLFAELLQLLHQVAMYQVVQQHFDLPPEHAALLVKFSQVIAADDIQLYYQIVLHGRKDLAYASDEASAFDMVLLRLLAFKPMIPQELAAVPVNAQPVIAIDFADNALPDTVVNQTVVNQTVVNQTVVPNANGAIVEQAQAPIQQTPQQVLAQELQQIETSAFEQGKSTTDTSDPQLGANELVQDHNVAVDLAAAPAPDISSNSSAANTAMVTPVDAVLATRNMLRSRTRQSDKPAKKSDDALTRHSAAKDGHNAKHTHQVQPVDNEQVSVQASNVPALESLPMQTYSPDIIDPAKVRMANEVDKWANMIDTMELSGRLRQLAIHATIGDNSSHNTLILRLDQSSKHLKTAAAQQQLSDALSQYLARPVTVDIELVEQTIADPYQIQSHINDKRYQYVRELLLADEFVVCLQTQFQAQLDENTIAAR